MAWTRVEKTKGPNFAAWMNEVPDPRLSNMVTYPLPEVLFTVFVGVLCGMEDIDEIVLFSRMNIEWFKRVMPFKDGIASAYTIRRVLSLVDARAFERCFTAWASDWCGRGVVAIDGKSLRGTSEGEPHDAIHTISAFAHGSGLVLGQRQVDGKSNEITAIPALLDQLVLSGAIVTLDAMGTQTKIAKAIRDKKADYILALKGNQSALHDDVRRFFDDDVLSKACVSLVSTDHGHGRIEDRSLRVTDDIAWLRELHPDWQDLHSIIAITSVRTDKKRKTTTRETRHYISSLPPDPRLLLDSIRFHWSIENTLHWSLDVTFGEDASRLRKDNAGPNMAVIRKTAFNALKKDPTKRSLKLKRIQAALDPAYRASLINLHNL
jgi:predicted transposase YbfD/YdcC